MIELTPDNNYEWVKCPDCGHKWQHNTHSMTYWLERGAMQCPECGHHLTMPVPKDWVEQIKQGNSND